MSTTDQRARELLEAALGYARAGFSVLPVFSVSENGVCRCSARAKCDKPGKHPTTQHGVNNATSDESKIRQFWQSNPLANVAIATGSAFGIVIDIDPRHGGDKSIQEYEGEHGALPPTVTANTGGGGQHMIFQDPRVPLKNKAILPGVDLKVTGGYVVVAPSIHASGKQYQWAPGKGPGEIPPAVLPQSLLDILTDKTANTRSSGDKVGKNIPDGDRNMGLASVAGKLVRAGLDPGEVLEALQVINQNRCLPPTNVDEVAKIAKSISRYGSVPIEWLPPKKLPSLEPEVPPLKKEMLPAVIADWAWDLAERMQCPPEFAAIPALTVLSSLIGGRTLMRPKKHDGWTEAPNLWAVVVAPPGSMKSPCLSEASKPINALQTEAMKEYLKEKIAYDAEEDAYNVRVKKLKDDFEGDDALAGKLEKELAQLLSKKPIAKRFIVNDSTTEKVGEILSENKTGILLFRDELFGFFMNLEKKGREADRALFLESWGGQSPYTFDRIGRGTVHIKKLCISILGGIQPDRLKQYFDQTLGSGSSDDGLLARFQLGVWPNVPKEFTFIDREPDKTLQENLGHVCREVVKWDLDGDHDALVYQFEADAQQVFDGWYETLQRRLRSGVIKSAAFLAHLSKFGSLMPSLALVFFITDTLSGVPAGDGVSLRHAEMAIAMCEYLEEHAKKIYAATIQPELVSAHALASKIVSGEIFDGMPIREVYRKQWRSLDSSELVRQGLTVLEKHDWIRVVELHTTGEQGGAPSEIIRVNPAARGLVKESEVNA